MKERYLLRDKKGKDGLGAGVWNLGPGTDPFGGPTRESIPILDRLFADPIFKDGAMTSKDLAIRKIAVENAKRAVDAITGYLGQRLFGH